MRKITSTFLSVIGICASLGPVVHARAADPVEWPAEKGGNGHWYQFVWITGTGPEGVCWAGAAQSAEAVGAHLLTIGSIAEAEFVVNAFCPGAGTEGAIGSLGWIGYQGTDQWIDGESVEYLGWAPGQPSGDGPYATLSCDLGWNDIGGPGGCHFSSELPLAFWVQEWSADCNADGIIDYKQIVTGQLADLDGNYVPDCCENGTECRPYLVVKVPEDVSTVQEAVDLVVPNGEVQVAPGIYAPVSLNGKPLTITGSGPLGAVVIDGSGTSRVVNAEGVLGGVVTLKNIAIVNGKISSSESAGGAGIFASGSTVVLDNVIVKGCKISYEGAGFHELDGAGVFAVNGDVTIRNSHVVDNSLVCLNTGDLYSLVSARGGGVAVVDGSLTIESSLFSGNVATAFTSGTSWHDVHALGGGVFADGAVTSISDCTFVDNSCDARNETSGVAAVFSAGGAVYLSPAGGVASIADCGFTENRVLLTSVSTYTPWSYNRCGGGAVWSGTDATIARCAMSSNVAANLGGVGSVIGAGIAAQAAPCIVLECDINGNEVIGSADCQKIGGGIALFKLGREPYPPAELVAIDSIICGNTEPQIGVVGDAGSVSLAGSTTVDSLCADPCPADVVPDGVVDGVDVAAVLGAWGSTGGPWNADASGDGVVDAADLALVLGAWGGC
ncbi:MAG: hypothetical protein JNM94_06960 [Phycisphaerae bacterium]|nr:hypothetical protein [Phycisphaerae bacterium]